MWKQQELEEEKKSVRFNLDKEFNISFKLSDTSDEDSASEVRGHLHVLLHTVNCLSLNFLSHSQSFKYCVIPMSSFRLSIMMQLKMELNGSPKQMKIFHQKLKIIRKVKPVRRNYFYAGSRSVRKDPHSVLCCPFIERIFILFQI